MQNFDNPLSSAAVKALLRQESAIKREIRYITLRLQSIRPNRHIWTIRHEIISLEKQLTRELARLNKINSILIKHGHRNEE